MKFKSSLLAIAAALSFSAQAVEFRSADIHNADDYPTVVAVKHMSTVLEKLSGGKHKIKVFNKGALGSEKETIDQVKIGALDLVRVNVAPMNGVCPMTMERNSTAWALKERAAAMATANALNFMFVSNWGG